MRTKVSKFSIKWMALLAFYPTHALAHEGYNKDIYKLDKQYDSSKSAIGFLMKRLDSEQNSMESADTKRFELRAKKYWDDETFSADFLVTQPSAKSLVNSPFVGTHLRFSFLDPHFSIFAFYGIWANRRQDCVTISRYCLGTSNSKLTTGIEWKWQAGELLMRFGKSLSNRSEVLNDGVLFDVTHDIYSITISHARLGYAFQGLNPWFYLNYNRFTKLNGIDGLADGVDEIQTIQSLQFDKNFFEIGLGVNAFTICRLFTRPGCDR